MFSSVFRMNTLMNGLGDQNQVLRVAVGSMQEMVEMIVPTSGVFGLARVKGNYPSLDSAADVSITVPMVTLDDMHFGGHPICAMKIDVEGHEPVVMLGAQTLLAGARVSNILMEFSPGYKKDGLERMLATLHESGYKAMEVNWGLAKIGKQPTDVAMEKFDRTLMRDISSEKARSHLIESVNINTNVWFHIQ